MQEPVERQTRGDARLPSRSTYYDIGESVAGTGDLLEAWEEEQTTGTRVRSPLRDALRRFRRNWAAMISLAVILILMLAAIFAPLLHTMDPTSIDFNAINQAPTPAHWFGTDPEGRDLYTRLLYGLRIPFVISYVGTFVTLVVGLGLGMLAGYYGGLLDSLLSRFTDVMFAFPSLLLSMIIVTLFGATLDRAFPNGVGRSIILIAAFALVSWPPLMRFVRGQALAMRESQYVEAARTVGTPGWKIITRHLIPNTWGVVLVQISFLVAGIIYTEAVLSLLGLGVTEPTPDLGVMVNDGREYMDANFSGVLFPSIFLIILIVAFTTLGDGIRDAWDPRGQD